MNSRLLFKYRIFKCPEHSLLVANDSKFSINFESIPIRLKVKKINGKKVLVHNLTIICRTSKKWFSAFPSLPLSLSPSLPLSLSPSFSFFSPPFCVNRDSGSEKYSEMAFLAFCPHCQTNIRLQIVTRKHRQV